MIRKFGSGKISFSGWGETNLSENNWQDIYGIEAYECPSSNKQFNFVFSQSKALDLIELEQLLQSVGWTRRPARRVKKALDHSLLKVGLWQHDPKFPRLIGFARCTGDEVLYATVWDVAIHPVYQGFGLGKELMAYILRSLKKLGIERVVLFADPGVVSFYRSQGWMLEPKGQRCAFWYAN